MKKRTFRFCAVVSSDIFTAVSESSTPLVAVIRQTSQRVSWTGCRDHWYRATARTTAWAPTCVPARRLSTLSARPPLARTSGRLGWRYLLCLLPRCEMATSLNDTHKTNSFLHHLKKNVFRSPQTQFSQRLVIHKSLG